RVTNIRIQHGGYYRPVFAYDQDPELVDAPFGNDGRYAGTYLCAYVGLGPLISQVIRRGEGDFDSVVLSSSSKGGKDTVYVKGLQPFIGKSSFIPPVL